MAVLIKEYYVSTKLIFFQSKIIFSKYLANPIEKYQLHSILRLIEKNVGEGLGTKVYSVRLEKNLFPTHTTQLLITFL